MVFSQFTFISVPFLNEFICVITCCVVASEPNVFDRVDSNFRNQFQMPKSLPGNVSKCVATAFIYTYTKMGVAAA